MKSVTALLPMKEISERIPYKNRKSFNGNPLYTYTLNTLLKSKYIAQVVINTDDEKLKAEIQKKYDTRVKVRNRDSEISGNYISMNKIIENDINNINSDIYLQTHATNPLLNVDTIDSALTKMLEILKNEDQDSIFSVSKTQKRFYDKNAKPMNHNPNMLVTQHLEPIYEENSCFYIFTKKSFYKTNSRIGNNPFMFEVNKIEAIDIDEPEDFVIAEQLYKILR